MDMALPLNIQYTLPYGEDFSCQFITNFTGESRLLSKQPWTFKALRTLIITNKSFYIWLAIFRSNIEHRKINTTTLSIY
jgi:hypothetical protein